MPERKANKKPPAKKPAGRKPAAKKAPAPKVHETKPTAEQLAEMQKQIDEQAEKAAFAEISAICEKYRVHIVGTFQAIGNQSSAGWTIVAASKVAAP